MDDMDDRARANAPPPGGYGLYPVARDDERIEPPKQGAPFRDAAPPPPSKRSNGASKWVGLPVVAVALFAARVLLVVSSTSARSPISTIDPALLRPIPTIAPSFDLPPPAPVVLGPMVVGADKTAYYVDSGALYRQRADEARPTWLAGQGSVLDVALSGSDLYALERLGLEKVSDEGLLTPIVVGDYHALAIDGGFAYLLSDTELVRAPLAGPNTGKTTVVAKGDALLGPMVVSEGYVHFVKFEGLARVRTSALGETVSKPWIETDIAPVAMRAVKGGVMVLGAQGLWDAREGKLTHVNIDAPDVFDFVVRDEDVYVAYKPSAGWEIARAKRGGGPLTPVARVEDEPGLALVKEQLFWSTHEGVKTVQSPGERGAN